jgi:hypothetical protein
MEVQPIHFDIFLKIATDLGISTRGLKVRVREFLDREVCTLMKAHPPQADY